MKLARGFSRQHRIIHFTTIGSASGLRLMCDGFAYHTPYTLTPGLPPPGLDYLPASPHRLPSTSLVRRLHHYPQLRRDRAGFTDLPWADQLDPGTLSQSAHTFLTCVSLLMPAFSLVNRPQLASAAASPGTRRSPTHPYRRWPYTYE